MPPIFRAVDWFPAGDQYVLPIIFSSLSKLNNWICGKFHFRKYVKKCDILMYIKYVARLSQDRLLVEKIYMWCKIIIFSWFV